MDRLKLAIESLQTHIDYDNRAKGMQTGLITIGIAEAEALLDLLKEQQPKTGHWLKKMSNYPSAIAMGGSRTSACDLCGGWGRKTFKYCPHCGAKMEEPTRT